MRFLKNIYNWLFKPDYIGFPIVRITSSGTEYQTMCWHSRADWWYWKGIFFIMRILEIPTELNKRMQKQLIEIRNKEI